MIKQNLSHQNLQTNELETLSLDTVSQKYNLDFKQYIAFEVMESSFLLKSLESEKITKVIISSLFPIDHIERIASIINLTELKL